MRSRFDWLLAAVVALTPLAAAAQPETAGQAGAMPTREEVRKARDTIENDPNLAAERSVNMLRWKQAEPVTDEPWWWQWANSFGRWARGLFAWLAESGRYVVWVLGAVLAAGLAGYLAQLARTRRLPSVPEPLGAPSHVRDLDIRPESLPDDVGAAALDSWRRGEQRAALALLYRGLLSRLVHLHGVPVRASSTEGECLALARLRLGESGSRYAEQLVATWAGAVYGGRVPAASSVEVLCSEFHAVLDPAAGAA